MKEWVIGVIAGSAVIGMLANDFVNFTEKQSKSRRQDVALRALASAIIEVDGGDGSIDELLAAEDKDEEALRRKVRAILDKKGKR